MGEAKRPMKTGRSKKTNENSTRKQEPESYMWNYDVCQKHHYKLVGKRLSYVNGKIRALPPSIFSSDQHIKTAIYFLLSSQTTSHLPCLFPSLSTPIFLSYLCSQACPSSALTLQLGTTDPRTPMSPQKGSHKVTNEHPNKSKGSIILCTLSILPKR